MLELAKQLAAEGLPDMESEFATATTALLRRAGICLRPMHKGVEAGIAAHSVIA